MVTNAASRMQFEDFTLDLARRLLAEGGQEIELRPKSFDLLCYLIQRRGELATKDDISQAVWPNVVATDDSITRCVSDVRRALHDSDQQIIKTVPGRGYVFVAEVSTSGGNKSRHDQARRWASRKKLTVAIILMVAGLGLISAGASLWPDRRLIGLPLPDQASIAVLPFSDVSGSADRDYLGDGFAQDLATALSKFSQLFVIADNSARKYKGHQVSPAQIGRELGVRYLLSGKIWKSQKRIRISVRLLEAKSGVQIWGEHYDREPDDALLIQADVTKKIVIRLVSHISRSELKRVARKSPKNWTVYDLYLRGNELRKAAPRDRTGAHVAAAKSAYQQALMIDPHYAPALEGLAAAYLTEWLNPFVTSPSYFSRKQGRELHAIQGTSLDRAEQLARHAIELDPAFAEAYATLAWVLHWRQGPLAGLRMFERALELNPNLANGRFANSLTHSGRATEAITFLKRVMRMDPFYPPIYDYFLGKSYFYAGRYKDSIERLRVVADALPALRPVLPIYAAAAALAGHDDEAQMIASKLRRVRPDFTASSFIGSMRLVRAEDRERLANGLKRAGLPR